MKNLFLLICLVSISPALSASIKLPAEHHEHEVRIHTPDTSVVLAGTLLVPANNYDGTVVLMITGSGDHSRDQIISGTPMFKVLAEGLADAGIASLRLDDRGTAASTGPTTRESTTADRTEDMVAALEWLRKCDLASFNRIGLLGHSEGALIIIKMAAKDVKPDFAIMLAAPTRPGSEVWVSQQLEGLKAGGFDAESVSKGERYLREAVRLSANGANPEEMTENTNQLFQLIGVDPETEEGKKSTQGFKEHMSNPWMRYFLSYDPTPDLQHLTMKLLAIYGSHDMQTIPGLNAPVLLDGLLKSGNHDFTIKIMPEQDHFFLRKPGEPVGVHVFKEMVLSEELINEVCHWIGSK